MEKYKALSDWFTSCGCGLVVFLVVTDECSAVQCPVSLPQEGLADGFQLSEFQTNFLQVERTPILDLPQWERIHVHKGDAHQPPVRNTKIIQV